MGRACHLYFTEEETEAQRGERHVFCHSGSKCQTGYLKAGPSDKEGPAGGSSELAVGLCKPSVGVSRVVILQGQAGNSEENREWGPWHSVEPLTSQGTMPAFMGNAAPSLWWMKPQCLQ